ncbi:hypothetical protein T01_3834 [Trichinella spiralis]|uniref:Uncharacterized protein n=1 Tax=Trichinella spiralis TaxID=6334 RepID=A0A0V1AXE1_TRISP|nr:hypothetical protein T01_3834 [Trichinella spiralis]
MTTLVILNLPGSHRRKDLQQFSPCLEEDGILRVGGRLALSDLPQETKNPCCSRMVMTWSSC